MKLIYLAGLMISMSLINGCATVTTGSDQTITIDTDPPGATCRMTREDEVIGVVNPTPGSVSVGKDKDEVEVSCELSGYMTTSHTFDSTFQGATLGNIILGGLIGIAIDAGSGAMHEYPASVFVRLQPEEFINQVERDEYFDGLVAEINGNTDKIAEGRTYSCNSSTCDKKLKKLNEQRDKELAGIESARNNAKVRNN